MRYNEAIDGVEISDNDGKVVGKVCEQQISTTTTKFLVQFISDAGILLVFMSTHFKNANNEPERCYKT